MTDNEIKLIKIIREHSNPVRALVVAINIIVSHLRQHGSSPTPSSVDLRERA